MNPNDKMALEMVIVHDGVFRDFIIDCRIAFSGQKQIKRDILNCIRPKVDLLIHQIYQRYSKLFPGLSEAFKFALKETVMNLLRKDYFYDNAAQVVAEKIIDRLRENNYVFSFMAKSILLNEKTSALDFSRRMGLAQMQGFNVNFSSIWQRIAAYLDEKYRKAGIIEDIANTSTPLAPALSGLLWHSEILSGPTAIAFSLSVVLITQGYKLSVLSSTLMNQILGAETAEYFVDVHNEFYKITKIP